MRFSWIAKCPCGVDSIIYVELIYCNTHVLPKTVFTCLACNMGQTSWAPYTFKEAMRNNRVFKNCMKEVKKNEKMLFV